MAAVSDPSPIDAALDGEARRILETQELPNFLARQRWFAGKARPIRTVRWLDWTRGGGFPSGTCLSLIRVEYQSGLADTYLLPIGLAQGARAATIERDQPGRVIGRLPGLGLIYDSLADPEVGATLLEAIAGSRTIPAGSGSVQALTTAAFTQARGPIDAPLPVVGGSFEQSNSAILFGDRLILKIFRRLDLGINPDFEIGRFLAEKTTFNRIPQTAGAILYEVPGSDPMMIGILQGLVPNLGTGWDHALGALRSYYERASATEPESFEGRSLLELVETPVPVAIRAAIGDYLDDAATLGRRTAELHLALASNPDQPAFCPEPMTPNDLDHLANEVTNQVEKTLGVLRAGRARLTGIIGDQADRVLDQAPRLLDRIEAGLDGDLGEEEPAAPALFTRAPEAAV